MAVHPRRVIRSKQAPKKATPAPITAAQVLALPPDSVAAQGFAAFLNRGGLNRPATKRQASHFLGFPQYRKVVEQTIAAQQAPQPEAVPVAA